MSDIRFGTAGLSESFKAQKGKAMKDMPEYTASFGLNAFEYQCGHGVRLAADTAEILRKKGEQLGIVFSLHAPYYISMSSMEEEKRLNSVTYILKSAQAVRMLGGRRVIFHSGSCGKQTREEALQKAKATLAAMLHSLDEEGYEDIVICPETMGKIGQLGTLQEVLELCKTDKRVVPCIDFGHLNARTQGGVAALSDYEDILNAMEDALQDDRARCFHAHFSKIEYSAGGEKRHLTFADTQYGPQYQPLLELCYKRNLSPTIICESAGTQAEDAQTMLAYWQGLNR
ncbi:MAG: TIM barrel protein [Oscillospiraceae bacterium]